MVEARDGTHLYVKSWGEGSPVVLIHGWPLSADSWDPVALALAENGYRAIAYDRRGFGRSQQPWQGYDYDTFADDLADVLESQGLSDDIALVGFSMGGGEVARYLSRYQGRGVSRVALISSIVPYMLQTEDNPQGVPQAQLDAIAKGIREDRPHFFRTFFKQFFGVGLVSHPVNEDTLDMAWTVALQAGLHPTLAAARAFGSTDFRPDLTSFRVPTLVIHGTSDKTVPIDATARAVAKGVPQAQLIEYEGEAHGIFATQTDRLIGDLLAFLNREASAFGGLEGATPKERQDLIDEVTAQSVMMPPL
jgi:pimeloyl-ACP methyl ester carboxylesterase